MKYFIDVAVESLNKHGEELCGDKVEIIKTEDSIIIVLADGLGSGVKANILSTLTSKIAGTMLREGASIYETVDTIVHTLPVCNVRKIAYSTFTILKIFYDGRVYAAEYDNPPIIVLNGRSNADIKKEDVIINGKIIKESNFYLNEGDIITAISDGVVHAGVGGVLNLGWQWENVREYLYYLSLAENCSKKISKELISVCNELYNRRAGDDTTAVVIKLRRPEIVDLFAGPPEDSSRDKWVIEKMMSGGGKKVVCGGTAAKIASRELNEELIVDLDYIDADVPPIARLKGIDLVTEGVLTLRKTVEIIRRYKESVSDDEKSYNLNGQDGASKLAKLLLENCTHLNLWIGQAINPAHQNPDFPSDLRIKVKIIEELYKLVVELGKEVKLNYV